MESKKDTDAAPVDAVVIRDIDAAIAVLEAAEQTMFGMFMSTDVKLTKPQARDVIAAYVSTGTAIKALARRKKQIAKVIG
jgi:hypothetical protein